MGALIPQWMVGLVLSLAVLAANAPFLNNRLFLVGPLRSPKSIGLRLLELCVYCAAVALLGRGLESHLGQVAPQSWEFYAVGFCTFATLAFPGFVWRYLRRGASR